MTDDHGPCINIVSACEGSWSYAFRIIADGDAVIATFPCGCEERYTDFPEGSCSCGAFTFERLRPPEFDLEIEYDRYGAIKFVKRLPIEYKPLPPRRRHKR